jgi:hypothetical protein
VRWYRAGVDVERRLPILSTYLGHTKVTDTYWYLEAIPELLRLALARVAPASRTHPMFCIVAADVSIGIDKVSLSIPMSDTKPPSKR